MFSSGDHHKIAQHPMEDYVALDVYSEPEEELPRPTPSSERSKKRKHDSTSEHIHCPWLSRDVDFDLCQTATCQLNAEIAAFYDWIKPNAKEHDTRTLLIRNIRKAIQSRWPDAQVEPFGSYKTQLYLPNGDIDLVVLSESIAYQTPKNVLFNMAALLKARGIAKDTVVIWKARVPIVKFRSAGPSDIAVDISLNQQSGLDAGPIVRRLLRESGEQAARSLIMVVKAFLAQRGLHEVFSGGLSSYSVIIMVVSFLRLHPKLQQREMDPARNLGVLLLEFFELYGRHFNYDRTGISVTTGYFDKKKKGWYRQNQPFLLSIADPQNEANNDVSGGTFNILSVRQAFIGAFDLLSASLCSRATLLKRQPTPRSRNELSRTTLLGQVLSITDEMTAQRISQNEAASSNVDPRHPPTSARPEPRSYQRPPPTTYTRSAPPQKSARTNDRTSAHARPGSPKHQARELPRKQYTPPSQRVETVVAPRTAPPVKAKAVDPEYIILDSDSEPEVRADERTNFEEETSRYAIKGKKATPAKQSTVHRDSSDSSVVEVTSRTAKPSARRDYWLAKRQAAEADYV